MCSDPCRFLIAFTERPLRNRSTLAAKSKPAAPDTVDDLAATPPTLPFFLGALAPPLATMT